MGAAGRVQAYGSATGEGVLLERTMNEAGASTMQKQERPAAVVGGQKRTMDRYICPMVYLRWFSE